MDLVEVEVRCLMPTTQPQGAFYALSGCLELGRGHQHGNAQEGYSEVQEHHGHCT